MANVVATKLTLETLVNHMFDQVLESPERAELISWIREWEAANPDVDNAHRITGWIDVAYDYQARAHGEIRARAAEPRVSWDFDMAAVYA